MAFYTDILIDQGAAYNATVPVLTLNNLPLDLTLYSGRGQIRRNYNSACATDFNVEVFGDPTDGLIRISLTPMQTALMKAGRYVFDIEVYTENDIDVIRVIEGQVTINPRATGLSSHDSCSTNRTSNTIMSGTITPPPNTIGNNGDYYIDKNNFVIFGPKNNNVWPSGTSLVGPQGDIGPEGQQGPIGLTGPQGLPGPQGLSTYEIAIASGFQGSEQDWLNSLVGPQGDVTAESLEQLLDDLGLGPTDIVPVVGLQLSDTGAVTLDSGTLGLNSSGDLIVHNGLSNGDDLPAITAGSTRSLSSNFLIASDVLNNEGTYLRKIGELDIPANWLTVGSGFSISGNVGLQYSQTFPTLDGKPLGGVFLLIGLGDFIDTDPSEIYNYTNFFSLDFVAENNLIKTVKDFQIRYQAQLSNSGDPNEIDVLPHADNGTKANIINSYLITPSVGGSQPEYSTEILSGWDRNLGDIFPDVLSVLPANTPNKFKFYIFIDPAFSEVSTNIEIYLNANIAKTDIVNI